MRDQARRAGTSSKDAISAAVRRGQPHHKPEHQCRLQSRPTALRAEVDLDRALRLAAADEDEDEKTVRKLAARK